MYVRAVSLKSSEIDEHPCIARARMCVEGGGGGGVIAFVQWKGNKRTISACYSSSRGSPVLEGRCEEVLVDYELRRRERANQRERERDKYTGPLCMLCVRGEEHSSIQCVHPVNA